MSSKVANNSGVATPTPTAAAPPQNGSPNKGKDVLVNKVFCHICQNPDPDIVEDYAKGDLICRECGVVLGDRIVDEHSEWRTFSNSESTGSDPNRVGGPTNPLLRDSGLSTVIGKGTSKDSSALSRMQNRGALANGDRSLLAGFKEIARMADHMGLPQTVQDTANELFREMDDKKSMKGRSADGILAASLYIACRIEGITRTFKEICALSNNVSKKDLGRCYKMMKEALANRINLQAISTEDFMTRFCTNLNLPLDVKRAAEHVSRTAMELGIVAGKNPISVAAASIYMVSQLSPEKRTQKMISDISGVSEVTIRNAYKDLYIKREQLLPPNSPFLTNVANLPSS
ncbi:transcription initiation factor IIB [Heterostelium album PN500]|uniref:Transcription initiation factor IIB n=1 Tax=Heterostelium pallidum (strain ATCC 26659 / Pp 5 / PN500) TaxID=670386 RepID=D3BMU1_HETP5|nr:transcription initiation factor IIB [Heterostelium album PN500]EFA77303.1 transcription initiation factor IIB [Heterostelium album PN500]|eukprot:XP_020429432.1 transcription initiation factor IIB [Heterostelium album PN500]